MEFSESDLRRVYPTFEDRKLTKLATVEAASLRPEAVPILKEEIARRGLSENLLEGIRVLREGATDADLEAMVRAVQHQPCPLCGRTTQRLNGATYMRVLSIVFMSNKVQNLIVACPDCLKKKVRNALIFSGLLGWWGFPWGIFYTGQAMYFNSRMLGRIKPHTSDANKYLEAFIIHYLGRIAAFKNDKQEMRRILLQEHDWVT